LHPGIYTGTLDCVVKLPEEVRASHTKRAGDNKKVPQLKPFADALLTGFTLKNSKSRGLSTSVSFVSPLHPLFHFFFGSRPIFRVGKTPKIPFLCLSLFPNPMEALATQAICASTFGIPMLSHQHTINHDLNLSRK